MKRSIILIGIAAFIGILYNCKSDNSNRENTGDDSVESPINAIPVDTTDNTRVGNDSLHKQR